MAHVRLQNVIKIIIYIIINIGINIKQDRK